MDIQYPYIEGQTTQKSLAILLTFAINDEVGSSRISHPLA
jgi:hypothetical protein